MKEHLQAKRSKKSYNKKGAKHTIGESRITFTHQQSLTNHDRHKSRQQYRKLVKEHTNGKEN